MWWKWKSSWITQQKDKTHARKVRCFNQKGQHIVLQVDLCSFLEAASGLFDISRGSEFLLINSVLLGTNPMWVADFLPLLKSSKHLYTCHYITLSPALQAASPGGGWLAWVQVSSEIFCGLQAFSVHAFATFVFEFSTSLCALWLVLRRKHISPGVWHKKSVKPSCEEKMRPHISVTKCVRGHWLEVPCDGPMGQTETKSFLVKSHIPNQN